MTRIYAGLAAGIVVAVTSMPCLAADAERGKAVFGEQKCSLCHSIDGVGNKKGALDDVGSRLTAKDLRNWLVKPADMTAKAKSQRKPPMKSFEKLPAADLDALVAYLGTLKKS